MASKAISVAADQQLPSLNRVYLFSPKNGSYARVHLLVVDFIIKQDTIKKKQVKIACLKIIYFWLIFGYEIQPVSITVCLYSYIAVDLSVTMYAQLPRCTYLFRQIQSSYWTHTWTRLSWNGPENRLNFNTLLSLEKIHDPFLSSFLWLHVLDIYFHQLNIHIYADLSESSRRGEGQWAFHPLEAWKLLDVSKCLTQEKEDVSGKLQRRIIACH